MDRTGTTSGEQMHHFLRTKGKYVPVFSTRQAVVAIVSSGTPSKEDNISRSAGGTRNPRGFNSAHLPRPRLVRGAPWLPTDARQNPP